MSEKVGISDFLNGATDRCILDVRSPGEYAVGHIPVAVSLPLFTDEERAVVGTLYKRMGKRQAVKRGLDIVGPKMSGFVQQADDLQASELAVYCWRGGMRSESMAWLLERYGLDTVVLQGGYKSYRRAMLDFFEQDLPLKVITGFTGSKKTVLLQRIKAFGGQIVDLEGLAGHQGSSFGNQKCLAQPSTEHFQNLVFDAFRELDLSKPIYIEDECLHIGRVALPESLYQQKNRSDHILVEVGKEERVHFLANDYGQLHKSQLVTATEAIKKKLGYNNASEAIKLIEAGALEKAVNIILGYYDKRYQKSLTNKEALIVERHPMELSEIDTLALQLASA